MATVFESLGAFAWELLLGTFLRFLAWTHFTLEAELRNVTAGASRGPSKNLGNPDRQDRETACMWGERNLAHSTALLALPAMQAQAKKYISNSSILNVAEMTQTSVECSVQQLWCRIDAVWRTEQSTQYTYDNVHETVCKCLSICTCIRFCIWIKSCIQFLLLSNHCLIIIFYNILWCVRHASEGIPNYCQVTD